MHYFIGWPLMAASLWTQTTIMLTHTILSQYSILAAWIHKTCIFSTFQWHVLVWYCNVFFFRFMSQEESKVLRDTNRVSEALVICNKLTMKKWPTVQWVTWVSTTVSTYMQEHKHTALEIHLTITMNSFSLLNAQSSFVICNTVGCLFGYGNSSLITSTARLNCE